MILQVETKKNSTQLAMLYPLHNKLYSRIFKVSLHSYKYKYIYMES